MTWWKRHRRQSKMQAIEDRLMQGGAITLHLAPDLAVHVSLNGLTMAVTSADPLPDEQARRLLLAFRYADGSDDAPQSPEGPPEDAAGRTIHLSLSRQENDHAADVLAAYFRLTED